MKTLITLCLSFALIGAQVQAQTNDCPPLPDGIHIESVYQCGWILPTLYFVAILSGGAFIIYMYRKNSPPKEGDNVTMVLQESTDNSKWYDRFTNTYTFSVTNEWQEIFRTNMPVNSVSFWRVRCLEKTTP